MNLALPALVVFILLLPGFIARSRIKRVERATLDYSPFGQVVSEAVAWALVLHLVWVGLLPWLTPMALRPDVVLRLFSAEPAAQTWALEAVAAQAGWVTLYFSSLLAFAYLGPMAFRRWVSRRRLDRHDAPLGQLFRFSGAPWYYLLSSADFHADDVPDFVSISAIVDVSGQPYLYIGLLEDYFLNQDGDLDRVILQQVMRRPLAKDKPEGSSARDLSRFYPVDGDYFVLRYSEMRTLNVEYIKLRADAAAPQQHLPDNGAPATPGL